MFQPNVKHRQKSFFGLENTLPPNLLKKLHESEEYSFYNIIFCNIKEEMFSSLYSDKASRPNAPVNCLMGSLILKEKYKWSYEQLFKRLSFDILTKTALGLDTLDDIPFDETTIFNFQNRLSKHFLETGENLIEQLFDTLTAEQLKRLKIKTGIQRSDSLMACSNIRAYSRLQLLVEGLLRLWRIMDEADKAKFGDKFSAYVGKSSGQYIYKLESGDFPREIEKIAEIYHFCKINIMPKYQAAEFSHVFDRIYIEHFAVVETKIEVRPKEELNSSCLQSPDDLDATYREKRGQSYRGQTINVTETASKDNPINLITDVVVNPNNVDDGQILNDRITTIMEKTLDLNELHTDGAYGNTDNDLIFDELGVTHVQTAVRGRQSAVEFEIEQNSNGYQVKCPMQISESTPTGKRNKCLFDKAICQNCQLADKCPAIIGKANRTFYFTHDDYLRNKRNRNLWEIPLERRNLRQNVEATVHEFTCRMNGHKLKVRTAFKATLFAFSVAIGVNFGRIYRYCV
jgi:hypothetical protein